MITPEPTEEKNKSQEKDETAENKEETFASAKEATFPITTDEGEEDIDPEKLVKPPIVLVKGIQLYNGKEVEKLSWSELTEACKEYNIQMMGFKRNEINGKLKSAIFNKAQPSPVGQFKEATESVKSKIIIKENNSQNQTSPKTKTMSSKKAKSKKKAKATKPAKKAKATKKKKAMKVVKMKVVKTIKPKVAKVAKPKADKKSVKAKTSEPIVPTAEEKKILAMVVFSHYKCFLLHKGGRSFAEIAEMVNTNQPRAWQNVQKYIKNPKFESEMKAKYKNA